MNILITGGAGFIGAEMVRRFCERDCNLTVVDRLDFGIPEDFEPLIESKVIDITPIDLGRSDGFRERLQAGEFDFIVHLAALTHIPLCESYPLFAYESTVLSTLYLLSNMHVNSRMLTFSTSSTYKPDDGYHDESTSELGPIDFYGIGKKHVEDLTRYYGQTRGLDLINIRLANAAGQGETNPKLIGTILQQLQEGQKQLQLGNLTPKRDYIHVSDISDAIWRLINLWPAERGEVEFFNLGTGHPPISVEGLAKKIIALTDENIEIISVQERKRVLDREMLYPNPTKLLNLLGDWQPMGIDQWLPRVVADPQLRLSNKLAQTARERFGY